MFEAVKIVREIVRVVPDLSERIKKARIEDGRSAQTLATLCGFSTAYWYQLEAGKRESVNEAIIRSIERVLGIDFCIPPFDDSQQGENNVDSPPGSTPKTRKKSTKNKRGGVDDDPES